MANEYSNILKSRYLAERSYLYFQYPGEERIGFFLPMLENPEISETQSINSVDYNLIGRSSNLYAYLGSRSRSFSLKFNITLPNILEYIYNIGLPEIFSPTYRKFGAALKSEEKAKFSRKPQGRFDFDLDYYTRAHNDLVSLDPRFRVADRSSFAKLIDNIFNLKGNESIQANPTIREAVNYLILWVNVIRTSTINNSKNTTLGPPMVFINHGTMYNNIPCICKNYSIRLNTPVGYDLISLTPRQIEISLSLEENRVGNFGEFKPFTWKDSENLAGWEAIVGTKDTFGTLDPYTSIRSEVISSVIKTINLF